MLVQAYKLDNTVELFRSFCGYVPNLSTIISVIEIWANHRKKNEDIIIFVFGEKVDGRAAITTFTSTYIKALTTKNEFSDSDLFLATFYHTHKSYIVSLDDSLEMLLANTKGDAVVLNIKRCVEDLISFWQIKERKKGFKKK